MALGSGTSGGTLAPLLLISGAFGSLVGTLFEHLVPAAHVSPGAFALVAMAAAFGASIRATFTAIVFLFELTRDYQIILPLMLASVLAELVAAALSRDSLMTEKLTRRGLRVQGDYEADVLQSTLVADVMTRQVDVVADDATVAEGRELLETDDHDALPVVDGGGRCVAIVTRHDLLASDLDPSRPVTDDDRPRPRGRGARRLGARSAAPHAGRTTSPTSPSSTANGWSGSVPAATSCAARLRQFQREHLQPGWPPLRPSPPGRRCSAADSAAGWPTPAASSSCDSPKGESNRCATTWS